MIKSLAKLRLYLFLVITADYFCTKLFSQQNCVKSSNQSNFISIKHSLKRESAQGLCNHSQINV